MCLGSRSAGMPAWKGCMQIYWSSLLFANVLLLSPRVKMGQGGLCPPCHALLVADAHNELPAPSPPSSFGRDR